MRAKHSSDAAAAQAAEGGANPTCALQRSKTDLHLAVVDNAAARAAIAQYHYTGTIPGFRSLMIGVWHKGWFWGVVMYGYGTGRLLGGRYGVARENVAELVRLALAPGHPFAVSRVLRVSLLLLRSRWPSTEIVFSFADRAQGHHGGIYQANDWVYLGDYHGPDVLVDGVPVHRRVCSSRFGRRENWKRYKNEKGEPRIVIHPGMPKHRYAKAFNPSLRAVLMREAQPFPK